MLPDSDERRVDAGCAAEGEPFSADLDQLEFGEATSTGVVHLAPGAHQLCLQLADGSHTATDLTSEATVNVAIESVEEWCAVADEIDSMFETIDSSDTSFTVRQVSYRCVGRLFDQLIAALHVFDADDRAAQSICARYVLRKPPPNTRRTTSRSTAPLRLLRDHRSSRGPTRFTATSILCPIPPDDGERHRQAPMTGSLDGVAQTPPPLRVLTSSPAGDGAARDVDPVRPSENRGL